MTRMRQFTADGKLSDSLQLLIEAGFKPGDMCRRKQDNTIGKLVTTKGDEVSLEIDSKSATVPISGFLKGEWAVYKAPAAAKFITNLPNPLESDVFETTNMKHQIFRSLNDLFTKHMGSLRKMYCSQGSRQDMFVNCKVGMNQLTIVPITIKIDTKTVEQPRPPDILQMEVNTPMTGHVFALSKMAISEGYVVPFWVIRVTNNEEEANCRMMYIKSGAFEFPCIRNSKNLAADEKLCVFKPKAAKVLDAISFAVASSADAAPKPGAKSAPKTAPKAKGKRSAKKDHPEAHESGKKQKS